MKTFLSGFFRFFHASTEASRLLCALASYPDFSRQSSRISHFEPLYLTGFIPARCGFRPSEERQPIGTTLPMVQLTDSIDPPGKH